MSEIQVDGARLHYSLSGSGPLLLFIAGAQGTGDVFHGIGKELHERFSVLTYDRRGFSDSPLDGAQDYHQRLATDADDVAALVRHVGAEPAHIFGSSSGAIVALTVLSRHPDVTRTLIAHEPPLARFLPHGEEVLASDNAIYEKYRTAGALPAMKDFMAVWMPSPTSDIKAFSRLSVGDADPRLARNMKYWFEHELRQYPSTQIDLATLRKFSDRIVLVMGEEMKANPTTPILEALSKELSVSITTMPGGHIGYAIHPADFARRLIALLDSL